MVLCQTRVLRHPHGPDYCHVLSLGLLTICVLCICLTVGMILTFTVALPQRGCCATLL